MEGATAPFYKEIFMKFLVLLVALVFSFNSFALLQSGTSNSVDGAGTVKHEDKVFIQIKAAQALTVGDVVILDVSANDGMTATKVSTVNSIPLCVVAETIASGAFGRCQVYGLATVKHDGTVIATAGQNYYLSATDGYASGLASPSATTYPIGLVYDTPGAASATVETFLKLL
jgi:hypothetical protein